MIVVDANLLLYAYDKGSQHHPRSRQWWEETLSKQAQVGLPWLTVIAFLRITTNARAVHKPLESSASLAIVSAWMARSNVFPIQAGARHLEILAHLVEQGQVKGPLMTDAHLAALAVEHGATLATHNKDFLRFSDLKVVFPLDEKPATRP